MKKLKIALMFIAMVLSLSSCSANDDQKEVSNANDNKSSGSSVAEKSSEADNKDSESESEESENIEKESETAENIEEETEVPEIIKNVVVQEEEWISAINEQDKDYSNYNISAADGDDYIWFQDMDMDGQPDFVTLSKYMPDTDIGTFRYFNVYTDGKDKLDTHFWEGSTFPHSGVIYSDAKGFESDTFNFSLWKGKNDKYHYLSSGVSGSIVLGELYELNMGKNDASVDCLLLVFDENIPDKGCELNVVYDKENDRYRSEKVLYAEGIKFYDDLFADLTPCDTTVKKIKLSEYTALSYDEKIKLLTDSYNAWSWSENGTSDQPLSETIEGIRAEINKTGNENDYAQVLDYFYNNIRNRWTNQDDEHFYGVDNSNFSAVHNTSYLWSAYGNDNKYTIDNSGYVLIDLNDDSVNELLVTASDEYSERILDIFTIDNGNIIHLAATGERDNFYICNDNVIGESGSSGAAHSATTYYKLENAILTPIEEYEADGDTDPKSPYYYADEFELKNYKSYTGYDKIYYESTNRKNISEEEFYDHKYSENKGIFSAVIPFSKYTPQTIVIDTPKQNETVLFTGYVNTEKDPLNVRKAPSTDSDILGKIDKDSLVEIYGESGDWYEIRYNGQVGYVSKQFVLCGDGFGKPVIYLYPEKKTDVSVKVNFKNGYFTCTYPEYNNGWNVTAYPDGKIINKADNDEYSYLYWEGEGFTDSNFDTGFVVKREDTAKFLKEKLSYMGLTPKEYNEFIVYWLPIMQKNEYNLVSFQMENYDNSAKLDITPTPDSMLRVFMAFKKADSNTSVPEQKLESFERKGFAVIEWGGTEIK